MQKHVNIRDEFHFSEVHGSMNAKGPVESYFACDLLRSYFHEPQKNKIYFLNVQNRFSHDMVLAIIMLMLLCYVVIKSVVTI